MKVLVVNGPNLARLGRRQPELYGTQSLADIEALMGETAATLEVAVEFVQTESEAEIVRQVHRADDEFDGLILNPGGLTHYSVAILDALLCVSLPTVEVHLTNLAAREEFRQCSLTTRGAGGRVDGFGADGYRLALLGIVGMLTVS